TPVEALVRLSAHIVFDLLPLNAEGWIGQEVVKSAALMTVLTEAVAAYDVGGVLGFEHHVRAADGVRLIVQFLPKDLQPCARVERAQVVFGDRQHAPGATCGVEQGPDNAGPCESLVVLSEEE